MKLVIDSASKKVSICLVSSLSVVWIFAAILAIRESPSDYFKHLPCNKTNNQSSFLCSIGQNVSKLIAEVEDPSIFMIEFMSNQSSPNNAISRLTCKYRIVQIEHAESKGNKFEFESQTPANESKKEHELPWVEKEVKFYCSSFGCFSEILHKEEVHQPSRMTYEVTIIQAFRQSSDTTGETAIKDPSILLRNKVYLSVDKPALIVVKLSLLIISGIVYAFFIKSLRGVAIQGKLTIQMFLKYLGFLCILYNVPLCFGLTKTYNILAVILLLFESLFLAYLATFLLIMVPSAATEHSTFVTEHNKTWKKVFLLIFFLIYFNLLFRFFRLLESTGGNPNSDFILKALGLSFLALNILMLVYLGSFFFKSFKRRLSIDPRYNLLLILGTAFSLSFIAFEFVLLNSYQNTVAESFKHFILTSFVVCLEYYYSKSKDSPIDGGIAESNQQKNGERNQDQVGNRQLEYTNYSSNFGNDSLQSEETMREKETISEMQPKKQIVKQAEDKREEQHEEVSYEMEEYNEDLEDKH